MTATCAYPPDFVASPRPASLRCSWKECRTVAKLRDQRHKGRCFSRHNAHDRLKRQDSSNLRSPISGHVSNAGSPPLFPRTCWKDVVPATHRNSASLDRCYCVACQPKEQKTGMAAPLVSWSMVCVEGCVLLCARARVLTLGGRCTS